MIPKVIHYCWFGRQPKSNDVKRYISSWRKYCPDYTIKEWNENNFNFTENTYCREAYDAKKWAFVSDYARLKILYENGGIYMDTDVELVKSLDSLINYNVLAGFDLEHRIQTGTLGASRNNFWIHMLLDDYNHRNFIQLDGSYDLTTNVDRITELTKRKYGLKLNGKLTMFGNNYVILPFDYLCAKSSKTGVVSRTVNTYAIHHFNGSWLSDDEKKYSNLIKSNFSKFDKLGINSGIAYALARVNTVYTLHGISGIMKKLTNKIIG
jgi:hypothetical protein